MSEQHGDDILYPPSFPRRRLAVGLADPVLERALLPVLQETGDFAIERCLAAEELLAGVRAGRIDVVLLGSDLPRLDGVMLADLRRTATPLVLLAPDPTAERWAGLAAVLPLEATPIQVRTALTATLHDEQPGFSTRHAPHQDPTPTVPEPPERPDTADAPLAVITVASGAGSPGRTTVALGLAAALGVVAPTVLVDADMSGPSLAAHLDADPTRNLFMLAHAEPRTPHDWDRALAQELQPFGPRSPHGVVLCGVPKPAMRAEVSATFFERAVTELRARYRYIVIDIGADLLGSETALHRTALGLADQVLLVASADLVGLSRLRLALDLCRTHLGLDVVRLAPVINRHDRRRHHGRTEIEWALQVPLAALVPYDREGVERALAAQHPVTLERRSHAGRALLDLASRIHAGRIVLPRERPARRKRWLRAAMSEPSAPGSSGSDAEPLVPDSQPSRLRCAWPWTRRAQTLPPRPVRQPASAPESVGTTRTALAPSTAATGLTGSCRPHRHRRA